MTILAYGDPHGVWQPLLDAAANLAPADTIIIVGDMDADRPMAAILKPVTDRGIRILWIQGNHDVDNTLFYDNTFGSMPAENFHGRIVDADGLAVGGLGGIFGGSVWYPREEMTPATHQSPCEYVAGLKHQARWRKGLPLLRRATIFPSDYQAIAQRRLDILVTHEAPLEGHEHGFHALDELAKSTQATLMIHGHHHRSYTKDVASLTIKGLAKAEVWMIPIE